ncbi:MAG: PAS domain-containing protein, partial [Spirochaetales bacterium]|nr:PAS domain-containing protein [Spirochaetales bacterium]
MEESRLPGGAPLLNEEIKRILDCMVEGCQIIDFDDRYIYVNDSIVTQAKTARESLIGHRMMEAFPGIQETEMFKRLCQCRSERKPLRMENEFTFPDGTSGWFELSIQPVPEGVLVLSMDITSKKLAESQMKRRLRNLNSLRRIDLAIAGSLDLTLTLSVALDQVLSQLEVDAACVLLLDQKSMTLKYAQGAGFYTEGITATELHLNEGLPRYAVMTKRRHTEENFSELLAALPRARGLGEEGFAVYHASPIIAKGAVIGVLEIFERKRTEHDLEWFSFLETLTGQIAVGIDSLSLFEEVQRSNIELVRSHEATIEGWSKALDLRDKETEGHTLRVTRVSVLLATRMRLSENEVIAIRRGALLHDIGKMGVPDHIL